MIIPNFYENIPDCQYNEKYDPDSSPIAWEHYRKVYTVEHWDLMREFDLGNTYIQDPRVEYKRLVVRIKPTSLKAKEKELWPEFKFGGDTDFNFNEKKVDQFKNILGNNTEYSSMLNECISLHHTLINFSLMAVSGRMNNFKGRNVGKNGYDRIDSFLYILKENQEKIVGYATLPNRDSLSNFLKSFDDIYDYCKKVYFIFNVPGLKPPPLGG